MAERMTRLLPTEPAVGREGSDTHLGSIAVCIVDTGVMALVQPLKGNRERSEERRYGHLYGIKMGTLR